MERKPGLQVPRGTAMKTKALMSSSAMLNRKSPEHVRLQMN